MVANSVDEKEHHWDESLVEKLVELVGQMVSGLARDCLHAWESRKETMWAFHLARQSGFLTGRCSGQKLGDQLDGSREIVTAEHLGIQTASE